MFDIDGDFLSLAEPKSLLLVPQATAQEGIHSAQGTTEPERHRKHGLYCFPNIIDAVMQSKSDKAALCQSKTICI